MQGSAHDQSLVTVPSSFDTLMLVPSKATDPGLTPTGKLPRIKPSLGRSSTTVLLRESVTQMLLPSKATPLGLPPTLKVPCTAPSLARNFVTKPPLSLLATQMLTPSKATP